MINWRDHGPITDAELVAWLDGMLDDKSAEYVERELAKDRDLEARVELLRAGDRSFAEVFDMLLEDAPEERLNEILENVKNPPRAEEPEPEPEPEPEDEAGSGFEPIDMPAQAPPRPHTAARPVRHVATRREPWGGWRLLAAAIVLVAVFAGGFLTSRFIPGLEPQVASLAGDKGWRAAVAEHQALFVKATLEQAGRDWSAVEESLKAAVEQVGLDLTAEKVRVEPLDLKYAAILNFKGKPLVQMAYLYRGEIPVSFCIIRSPKPAHGIMAERRQDLNIAHWQAGDFGFMVIGDVPEKDIDEIARKLKAQVS